ncbi:MAG: hypothetical protein M1497_04775 [Nitrospirae bacterium]|nr:hypothetical protein [Nitrospirota bacterium]
MTVVGPEKGGFLCARAIFVERGKAMRKKLRVAGGILAVSLLCGAAAEAQWVFLGRKALGAVQRFTSKSHDTVSVLLEAEADKVYSTAVALLADKQDVRITYRDDRTRTVEFTDGRQSVGMKVSRLEERLSQLLISSDAVSSKSDGPSLVLDGVFRVCREMGVHCSLAAE